MILGIKRFQTQGRAGFPVRRTPVQRLLPPILRRYIAKATVPINLSPNTTPRLLYEELKDSNGIKLSVGVGRDRSCPTPLSEQIIIDNLPDPPGESISTTEHQHLSNTKSEKARTANLLAEWNSKPISKWWTSLELKDRDILVPTLPYRIL
jgi:hypothetical protein